MRTSFVRVVTTIVVGVLIVGCATASSPAPITPGPPPSASSSPAAPTSTPSASPTSTPSPSTAVADESEWVLAGDLVEARDATNVVVLGTGEALVVGSDYRTSWLSACGAATGGSDSVEIGNGQVGQWEQTTSLKSKRETPVLVALKDGRALLTGGETGENDGNVAYSSTYVFDPADRSWTRFGLLNTARSDPAGALLADGRVLVAGGRYNDREDNRVLDSSELWDPRTGNWTQTGRLADPRVGASAVTLADGRVLIVGGVRDDEDAPFEQGSAEIYDPGSGRWSSAGSLATARTGFTLVALADGGAIAAGGFDSDATGFVRLGAVDRFDPTSNTWSQADDLPFTVAGASAVRLADGRVLLAGGSAREPEVTDDATGAYLSGLTDAATLFDPETGSWTSIAPMPMPRAGASAVLLADGSALFVGGSASEGVLYDTPGCPVAEPRVVRYVPGS